MWRWRVAFGVAVLLLLTVAAWPAAALSRDITILVNGELQRFDTPPFMADSVVLVPLRGVFENLGATVVWVGDSGVIRTEGGHLVRLKLGSREAFIGPHTVQLETAPRFHEGRVYVPLRFVSESLGARVTWDPQQRRVEITAVVPPPREPATAETEKPVESRVQAVPPTPEEPAPVTPEDAWSSGDDPPFQWNA